MRLILLSMAFPALLGATMPETRFAASLPSSFEDNWLGRLLLFDEPATLAMLARPRSIPMRPIGTGVSMAARDVAGFGATSTLSIDASAAAFPGDFAMTAKGDYRVQVVLDRNGDYNSMSADQEIPS